MEKEEGHYTGIFRLHYTKQISKLKTNLFTGSTSVFEFKYNSVEKVIALVNILSVLSMTIIYVNR